MAEARFDTARYQRYCDAHPERADCVWYRSAGVGADQAARLQLERAQADDRIGAVFSFDLGLTQAFDPTSVASIATPVLVIGAGSSLPRVPVEAESRYLATILPEATTHYHESTELTHFTFFSECRPGAVEMLIAIGQGDEMICEDGGNRSRAMLHAELITMIEQFLRDAGFPPPPRRANPAQNPRLASGFGKFGLELVEHALRVLVTLSRRSAQPSRRFVLVGLDAAPLDIQIRQLDLRPRVALLG